MLRAQGKYPGIAYRDYSRCLPDFLRQLAEEAYQNRNRRLQEITSPELIRQRQEWVKDTFWDVVGGKFERTPLNAKVIDEFERDEYRVQNILYESRPNFHIGGNLYIPKAGQPPFPAVLFQMGHSLNGKEADTYQRCCQGLVKLGFVVLGFDPMGQGERTYYPTEGGTLTRLSSADDEHSVPGMQMLLIGDTSTQLQVWDAIRSLDFLADHPLVDPARMASTGQSGGGTLTMLLAAVDDRIAAAVVSCGNTENVACANFNPPGSTDDAEQNLIDSAPRAFDRWDLLYPMAPKPLLVAVSAKDFFGTYSPRYISNGWEEFGKLKQIYTHLGAEDQIRWVDSPLPHNLAYDMRIEVYNWFRRWLQGEETPVELEPPTEPEPGKRLWVSKTGNLVRDLGGETPFSLNLKRAESLAGSSESESLRSLLKIDFQPESTELVRFGSRRSGDCEIVAVEIRSEAGVWIPSWIFQPAGSSGAPGGILVALEPGGRSLRWREGGLYQNLASEGFTVCVPDLRGIGDVRPEYPRGAARHASWHQDDLSYAWSSLIFGRPLVGQRALDLLQLFSALRSDAAFQGSRISLAARGSMTVPAVFASVLDTQVQSLLLSGGLASFRSVIEHEVYDHPFSNFVPRLLRSTDLPELLAGLVQTKVVLAGFEDGAGEALTPQDVRDLYPGDHIQVEESARWDENALSRLVRPV